MFLLEAVDSADWVSFGSSLNLQKKKKNFGWGFADVFGNISERSLADKGIAQSLHTPWHPADAKTVLHVGSTEPEGLFLRILAF